MVQWEGAYCNNLDVAGLSHFTNKKNFLCIYFLIAWLKRQVIRSWHLFVLRQKLLWSNNPCIIDNNLFLGGVLYLWLDPAAENDYISVKIGRLPIIVKLWKWVIKNLPHQSHKDSPCMITGFEHGDWYLFMYEPLFDLMCTFLSAPSLFLFGIEGCCMAR